ncbi:hypothetical protein L9F63_004697, partial [Diploptera punctata]
RFNGRRLHFLDLTLVLESPTTILLGFLGLNAHIPSFGVFVFNTTYIQLCMGGAAL